MPDPGGATSTAVPRARTAATTSGSTARTGRSAPVTSVAGSITRWTVAGYGDRMAVTEVFAGGCLRVVVDPDGERVQTAAAG